MAATSEDEVDAATEDSVAGDDDSKQEPEVVAVAAEEDDEEEVVASASVDEFDDDEAITVKSELTAEDDETSKKGKPASSTKKRKKTSPPPSRKGRTPAVQGLTIPFRAIKRTMKLDADIGTVQNEAAIITTVAAELFVQSLARESHHNAKSRGRNTIRYEDVAEARTKNPALSFLAPLIP